MIPPLRVSMAVSILLMPRIEEAAKWVCLHCHDGCSKCPKNWSVCVQHRIMEQTHTQLRKRVQKEELCFYEPKVEC
jgi:hypothetical protein